VDSFAHASALESELQRTVRGEVRFDAGARALYATDASNYRHIPIGLVVPRDDADVIAAVTACRKYEAPILARGAGTSLAGQCCNVAVVLDFSKYMNRILDLDPARKSARVQPGVVLDTLRNRAEKHKLTFGPDPSTHNRCTLGGMIGNNSCGTHSLLAGKTVDNVAELRILLYDGTQMTVGATSDAELAAIINQGGRRAEIYAALRNLRDQYAAQIRAKFPNIPRRVSGYNLDQLLPENGFHVARALVGTEGTCVTVLEAHLNLIHSPQYRTLIGLGYPDAFQAADHVPEILEFGPIGLEGFEASMIDNLRKKNEPRLDLVPEGRGILLVEFGSDHPENTQRLAQQLIARLQQRTNPPAMRIYTSAEAAILWRIREAGVRSAATAPGAPPEWEGWDDAAVAPEKVGAYLRDIRKLLDEYHYQTSFYGHFGHGCIHMRVNFDLQSEPGIRNYGEFVDRAADLVLSHGGSLSGEHGDGQSRAALLPKMFGPDLMRAFAAFKAAWDPQNKMNPHKVLDAGQPTEDLRLGADYRPLQLLTHFKFPDDDGSFAQAGVRCIGLGECRKNDTGAMCPSYMVTLEEEHSTRGRAHLLFELLQGEIVRDAWKNEQVKRALDLCLSCKACKSECPTNVDIATYRAEFLAHYYEGRSRPLHAYAFGLIDRWARTASRAPRLVNFLTHAPVLATLLRNVLHLEKSRQLPRFAPLSFTRWCRTHAIPASEDPPPPSPNNSAANVAPRSSTRSASAPATQRATGVETDAAIGPRPDIAPDPATGVAIDPAIVPKSGSTTDREPRPTSDSATGPVPLPSSEVILWADTFNNYFHPQTAQAAVEVLRDAGFHVTVPAQHLCCGRPLYDFGMLAQAAQYLTRILQILGPKIDAGVPVVVLEPSCASVFRDELRNLFPADARAARLRAQTFLLGEFLRLRAPNYHPPPLARKVFLHGHCHQRALVKTNDEAALLAKINVELESVDAGCCGMAGSFGYERKKFAVSQAIGERVLLPAVRQAAPDTLIISDGFSCREQIRQSTGREPLHFAEALQLAIRIKSPSHS
jgi:FAD/FMN-containing dehydrogenase/Fe-S oxidoreductase